MRMTVGIWVLLYRNRENTLPAWCSWQETLTDRLRCVSRKWLSCINLPLSDGDLHREQILQLGQSPVPKSPASDRSCFNYSINHWQWWSYLSPIDLFRHFWSLKILTATKMNSGVKSICYVRFQLIGSHNRASHFTSAVYPLILSSTRYNDKLLVTADSSPSIFFSSPRGNSRRPSCGNTSKIFK